MAVVMTRLTRAIKKKKKKKNREREKELNKNKRNKCNMIGYKARANLEKKKTGLKTMAFSFSARKVRKFRLEILPTISKPFEFHSRAKNPRTLPWKKTSYQLNV